jgi:hypothetical protein
MGLPMVRVHELTQEKKSFSTIDNHRHLINRYIEPRRGSHRLGAAGHGVDRVRSAQTLQVPFVNYCKGLLQNCREHLHESKSKLSAETTGAPIRVC